MAFLPLTATLLTPILILVVTAYARRNGLRAPYRVFVPVSLLTMTGVAFAVGVVEEEPALRAVIVLGFALAAGYVHYLDDPSDRWATVLRSRFLIGVPWGTLISIALVSAVYLFLQGGLQHPNSPLSIPFTSWSYYYPIGLILAPFAHVSLGHVTGNLIGTVALAPLAEYAWSHFPTSRGSTTFSSWRTNPYVRAFVLFPVGVVLVGLGTSVFSWGAIIGFSGVVFAFAGFAVIRYPLLTVVVLSARGAISTTYYAIQDPVVVGTASPSFGPPWWVGIAVQGHLLGLFLGILLGLLTVGRRRSLPSAGRLLVGIVLLGFSLTLYALWWYRNPSTFVLYRGIGILLIIGLAVLITTAVRSQSTELFDGVTTRQLAIVLTVLPLLTMALVAVPINATTIEEPDPPSDAIEVQGYQVYYAEDVSNERISGVSIGLLDDTTSVNASGVIVVSERRHIWTEVMSAGALGFWGEIPIRVGGVGWESTIWAKRTGWQVAGGGPVYNVYLKPPGGEYTPVYTSRNDTAGPTIDYRNVTVVASPGEFTFVVTNNTTTIGTAQIPGPENTTRAGGLMFHRTGDQVYVIRNGTRVLIATKGN